MSNATHAHLPWSASRLIGLALNLCFVVIVGICLLVSSSKVRADNIDGAWSSVENWPLIAIHAAITPDGRVLSYGTKGDGTQTGFFIYDVWDPQFGLTAGHMTLSNLTATDIFCSSQIILPQSGEILIAGGDNWTGTGTTNTGNNNSNLFDYGDNSLAASVSMNRSRWYSSSTALVNGEVYIQGGNGGGDRPEVRETTGGFRLLTGASTNSYAATFPRNFLAPDGRVFGYDTSGKMYFVETNGMGSVATAGQFSSSNAGWTSGAAMFQPGKILQIGGNSNGAVVIDINGPEPSVTATQSMSSTRKWVSATVLADGRVLATGGSSSANQMVGVNNSAEIWDSDTGQWQVGPSAVNARLYHSSALLLPDGSALIAGGGAPGPLVNTNAEIYYPSYLYEGVGSFAPRPHIVSAPDTANVGDSLTVQVDTLNISRVTLAKTGSVTHSVNMDQRFLELLFTQSGNMLDVSLPVRASDTPPGFYLMFAFNDTGVPSVAKILRINIDSTPNTAVDYTPAIGGSGGSAFQLACNTDEILVGVHGKYATYVNQIGPQCVTMDQLGRWIGDPVNGPVTGTTNTGTDYSKTCPRDFAVSGFQGRAGDYVNQLEIECKALTPTGSLTGAGQFLGSDGGSGGSSQGPYGCGTNNPVYALYGRSGGWLDSFGMLCRQGVITPISINSEPVVVNPGTQSDVIGIAVNLQINASDGDGDDLTFGATGLPPGLTIDADTGEITGTPTTEGTFNVQVTVSDGTDTDVAYFDWNIAQTLPLAVDAMTPQAPQEVNTAINYTASASGGLNRIYRWDFGDGTPETNYSSSPSIAHTFTAPGIFYVTLTVNDDFGIPQIQVFVQLVHLPLTASTSSSSTNISYEKVSVGNSRVWVVNQDNDTVTVFDAATHAKLAEIPVGAAPRSVAIAPDGRTWITNKTNASISIIDPIGFVVVQTVNLPFASQPHGIVFSTVANEAYVVLEATGKLLKMDASNGTVLSSVDTVSRPRHLTINGAGTSIYVSNFVTPRQPGEETAVVSSEIAGVKYGGEIDVVDSTTMAVLNTIILQHSDKPDFENQGRGVPNYIGPMAISPDGISALIPSKQDNIGRGTLRDGLNINFQNTVRAIVSVVDPLTENEVYSGRIDLDNSSVASAVIFDPIGIYAFAALETSREVAILDVHGGAELFRVATGRAPQGMGISSDGLQLFVSNFMDRTIEVFDLTDLQINGQWNVPKLATLQSVSVEKLSPQVLQGKQFFYDAFDDRLAFDNYLSCATCHNDGVQDGRTWDLTGMGEGLRNTISLKGHAGAQGPLHWTENFDEVQDFEGQIRALSAGTGLMSDADFNTGTRSEPLGDPKAGVSADLDALAAYVGSLNQYARSPHRNSDGSLSVDGIAGRAIFENEGCAVCHSGPDFTDSAANNLHDIGTLKASSGNRLAGPLTGIDTPTLRGAWASAPYLHDGSAETLADAVAAHNFISLDSAEMTQLAAYLQQIDVSTNVIVDNLDANTSQTGTWKISGGAGPYNGSSIYCNTDCTFTWQPNLPASGTYDVYAYWTYFPTRSSTVPYRIEHDSGTNEVTVDQLDPTLAGRWIHLGTYDLTAGINGNVRVSSENGQVSADAVRFEFVYEAPPDTIPPTDPTGLSATANGSSQIDLSWTGSADNVAVAGYNIYQDHNYTSPVATSMGTSHSVQGLAPNTQYVFELAAIDLVGNESGLSNEASATTLEATVFVIVDNLDANTSQTGNWKNSGAADAYNSNSIYCNSGCTFTWQPTLPASGTYEVYGHWTYYPSRAPNVPYRIDHDGGEAMVVVDQLDPALAGQWTLLGTYNLTAGVNGDIWITSENGQANADAVRYVRIGEGSPDTSPPSIPSGLTATGNSSSQVDLAWTASTDNVAVAGYNVYQNGDYTAPVAYATSVDHTVVGLAPSTSYAFEIAAVDMAGNQSGLSNVANATTLAASVEVIVDNQDVNTSQTGIWKNSGGAGPYNGNSIYCNAGCTFTWQPTLPAPGTYEVYGYWTYFASRSSIVPYYVINDAGIDAAIVDQQNPALASQWVLLGTYDLTPGVNGDVTISSENGQASADAVRFVLLE